MNCKSIHGKMKYNVFVHVKSEMFMCCVCGYGACVDWNRAPINRPPIQDTALVNQVGHYNGLHRCKSDLFGEYVLVCCHNVAIYRCVVVIFETTCRLDCTLRELMSLIREVNPDTRAKGTMFQFSTVYPDARRGGYRMKELGQTCSGRRGTDDNITLHSRKFQIGDYLDVAISLRPARRPF